MLWCWLDIATTACSCWWKHSIEQKICGPRAAITCRSLSFSLTHPIQLSHFPLADYFLRWSSRRLAETGSWSIQLTIKELRLSLKFITFCVMIFSFIHFISLHSSFIHSKSHTHKNFINITATKKRKKHNDRRKQLLNIHVMKTTTTLMMTKSLSTTTYNNLSM